MNPPPPPSDPDPHSLRQAMAAVEAQRGLLGDAVTELALAPLRQLLAAAATAETAETAERAPKLRRAQVTVLFADIVGSTALAGRLDAEDTLELFGGVLQRAAECVRAHGGRVLRFTGDGLKAAFGTQGAHEDDAAQAVQAGLDILTAGRLQAEQLKQRLGLQDFALRVGVHTGEVAFGAGFEADNTLTGDAVNVAARMEQSAPPGGLRISADTWAQVRGRFNADQQPPLLLKGFDSALQTWLVHAAVAASATDHADAAERGVEGLRVAMVGRQAELARLRQALAAAITAATATANTDGSLQAVTVVAAAGLGKTRLLCEALDGAAQEGKAQEGKAAPGPRLLRARAQPRDKLRAWGLLNQLVAAHCGITDGDSAEIARAKLLAGLTPGLTPGLDGDAPLAAERQAQLIGQLIGLDFNAAPGLRGLDARALRDLALAAVLAWLGGLCRQLQSTADGDSSGTPVGVLVLAIEDLHWADEASLDLLQHLMTQGRHLPLALLMNSRPDLLESRPGWCEGGTGTRITLAPLTAADGDALATALLQRLPLVPTALRELLTSRAEGNPYYMEELLRRLLDDGVIRRDGVQWQVDEQRLTQLRLPTTLVGLLQARLDALPEAERDGAQRASIVGHVFWDAALGQIDPDAPAAMPGLQRRGWLLAHAASAFDDTAERQFDHHLLHQVTYETVLKAERRRGHAVVARWLAERTAGRGPEFLAITGEHAARAGDAALAIDCYERAAVEAQQRFANTLAIDCLQRALALMPEGDVPRRLKALDNICDLAGLMGMLDLQEQALDTMMAVLDRHPDPHLLANVTVGRAMLADRLNRLDDAFALATEALALATDTANDAAAARAHGELCWLNRGRKDFEAAWRHQAAGQVHAERVRDTVPYLEIQFIQYAGVLAYSTHRMDEFAALMHRSLDLAQACGENRTQLRSLDNLCAHADEVGDFERMASLAEHYLSLARRLGATREIGRAHWRAGISALARGDTAQALAAAAQTLGFFQAGLDSPMIFQALALAGLAHAQRGDAGAARADFVRAGEVWTAHDPEGPQVAQMAALVARHDLILGDIAAARSGVEHALAAAGFSADLTQESFVLHAGLACFEVLCTSGDTRAAPVLAQLQERLQAFTLERGGSPEAAHALQQRIPIYRSVMQARMDITTSAAAS